MKTFKVSYIVELDDLATVKDVEENVKFSYQEDYTPTDIKVECTEDDSLEPVDKDDFCLDEILTFMVLHDKMVTTKMITEVLKCTSSSVKALEVRVQDRLERSENFLEDLYTEFNVTIPNDIQKDVINRVNMFLVSVSDSISK